MKFSLIRGLFTAFTSILLASCASIGFRDDVAETPPLTEQSYAERKNDKAVVLLDVNWGRKWGCADYQNAQIITFTFDKMPEHSHAGGAAVLTLTTPNKLLVKPMFISYAFLLAPGEYALSSTKIKVARSASDVGYLIADRSHLLPGGKSYGSFRVNAGETVYIGNFSLDCHKQPMLWRYYTVEEKFSAHIGDYKRAYPFLDLSNVTYRLFETEVFGQPYKAKK